MPSKFSLLEQAKHRLLLCQGIDCKSRCSPHQHRRNRIGRLCQFRCCSHRRFSSPNSLCPGVMSPSSLRRGCGSKLGLLSQEIDKSTNLFTNADGIKSKGLSKSRCFSRRRFSLPNSLCPKVMWPSSLHRSCGSKLGLLGNLFGNVSYSPGRSEKKRKI